MDKAIKKSLESIKKKTASEEKSLVKKDKVRDRKCERAEKVKRK